MNDNTPTTKPPKAYANSEFLNSRAGRPLRILSEFHEPLDRFDRNGILDTIVFFGSARVPSQASIEEGSARDHEGLRDLAIYYEATRELSRKLTEWSLALPGDPGRFVVCTGGGPGIMEAANRGAHDAGGRSIGLTISIPVEEFENHYVTPELSFEFHYFFMRKFWFTYLTKAVVIMPGGFGTLDEMFELLTLMQTLKMKKRMPIVLFGKQFWSEVLNLEALVRHGTVNEQDLALFHPTDSVEEAFDYITNFLVDGPPERGPVL